MSHFDRMILRSVDAPDAATRVSHLWDDFFAARVDLLFSIEDGKYAGECHEESHIRERFAGALAAADEQSTGST